MKTKQRPNESKPQFHDASRVNRLTQANKELHGIIESLRTSVSRLNYGNNALHNTVELLAAKCNRLTATNEVLQAENQRLKEELGRVVTQG